MGRPLGLLCSGLAPTVLRHMPWLPPEAMTRGTRWWARGPSLGQLILPQERTQGPWWVKYQQVMLIITDLSLLPLIS